MENQIEVNKMIGGEFDAEIDWKAQATELAAEIADLHKDIASLKRRVDAEKTNVMRAQLEAKQEQEKAIKATTLLDAIRAVLKEKQPTHATSAFAINLM